MELIPNLFKLNPETGLAIPEVTEGCEWVLAGEGVATRQWDGVPCMVRDGRLYKRHVLKPEETTLSDCPEGWRACGEAEIGFWPGWVPVTDGLPEDRWYRAARASAIIQATDGGYVPGIMPVPPLPLADGTYELCGPKINGNPEQFATHVLIRHGVPQLPGLNDVPWWHGPNIGGRHTWLSLWFRTPTVPMKGIVWHHPDGRMAKVRGKDFGIQWPSMWAVIP